MGRVFVTLPDDLDEKFRKEVGKRYGAKRGSLEKAFIEAVELWMHQSPQEVSIKTRSKT
jgi:hypothetical protein